MNCLSYALRFWEHNNDYKLFYNSFHVFNLDASYVQSDSRYLVFPVEEYGYDYFAGAFKGMLDEHEQLLLKKYFNQEPTLCTTESISTKES